MAAEMLVVLSSSLEFFPGSRGYWRTMEKYLGEDLGSRRRLIYDLFELRPGEDDKATRCCIREQLVAEVLGLVDPC